MYHFRRFHVGGLKDLRRSVVVPTSDRATFPFRATGNLRRASCQGCNLFLNYRIVATYGRFPNRRQARPVIRASRDEYLSRDRAILCKIRPHLPSVYGNVQR